MNTLRTKLLALQFSIFLVAAAMLGAGAVRAANAPRLSKAEAVKLQDQFQNAVVKADTAALDKLMASDCQFIHGNGMQQSKAVFMDMLKSGRMKVTEFKSTSPQVIQFDGGAIVSSVADWGMMPPRGGPNANPMVLHMRISQVWVRTAVGWQMILEQDTTLAQPSGMRQVGSQAAPSGAPKP